MKSIQNLIEHIRAKTLRCLSLVLLLFMAQAIQAQTLGEQAQMLQDAPEMIGQLDGDVCPFTEDQDQDQDQGDQPLEDHSSWLRDAKHHPVMGASEPELTLVVFNDYNCPFCKRLEPVLQQLLEEYEQVQVVHIFLPLRQQQVTGLDTNSALYSMNVWRNAPEKFEQVHEMLMDRSSLHSSRSLTQIAQMTDTEEWLGTSEALEADVQQAQQIFRELGLRGTPSLIIGDQLVPGYLPYGRLQPLVEQALSQAE